jgi:hypothetical protein
MSVDADISSWCRKVAELGVDVLVDCELVRKENFDQATAIVAEEIMVRLNMGDYPPIAKDNK